MGVFLYKTALCDLPMIINVIKGDLSIVGVNTYTRNKFDKLPDKVKKNILKVKPGIITLWNISSDRQHFKLDERYKFDILYLNNISLKSDFCIIMQSVLVVFGIMGTIE